MDSSKLEPHREMILASTLLGLPDSVAYLQKQLLRENIARENERVMVALTQSQLEANVFYALNLGSLKGALIDEEEQTD